MLPGYKPAAFLQLLGPQFPYLYSLELTHLLTVQPCQFLGMSFFSEAQLTHLGLSPQVNMLLEAQHSTPHNL
jgi:hypothetical protein